MNRISRSFQLVQQSYRLLMKDTELMFLPFLAGVIVLAAGIGLAFTFGSFGRETDELQAGEVVPAFLFTGAITLLMFFAALQGVYIASLYRFATEGQDTAGFDHDLLANAFVPK